MGKIRVQDLARMMGVANQDLLFKLRAIGVRVEGEDAAIDKDVIDAILQGKRMRQPREVILRDDSTPEPTTQAPPSAPRTPLRRRPPGGTLRPTRRTMIQRVEPRIRNIERRTDLKSQPPGTESQDNEPAIVEARDAAITEVPQEEAVAEPSAASSVAAPAETEAPQEQATEQDTTAAAAQEPAPKTAKSTADKKAKSSSTAAKKASTTDKKARSGARRVSEDSPSPMTARRRTPARKPTEKTIAERKAAERRAAADRPPQPPSPPMRATGRPHPGDRRPHPGDRRGRRHAPSRRGRDDMRSSAPRIPSEPTVERAPSSARGLRRSERRQEAATSGASDFQFKVDRPDGPVTVAEGMTVREFAEKLGIKAKDMIKLLFQRGIMANINHILDAETATQVAEFLGVETMEVSFEEEVQLRHEISREGDDLAKTARAPVVTVMGHVDHGKTTLLDAIRSANVAAGEAGGITQHIAAYQVEVNSQKIVFLDTPGHEAFTLMRARGAQVTDLVILVVAADDGVMPQTLEAIDHAKAADVPLVVAINKVDKANANLDRVKKELSDHGLLVEDWGGDVVAVPISALKREGIDELLEMIVINADLLELKAMGDTLAQGTVLETRKDVGRGIVATVLVQEGTLKSGDTFVAGSTWGRVRSMSSDRGERLDTAPPATPIEVTGFTDIPAAGDVLQVVTSDSEARSIADFRRREERQRELAPQAGRMSLEQFFSQMGKDEVKELPIIIKADVHGSVEVLRDALAKLSTEKVKIKVIHAAVGAISTNDVILAAASNAIIVGFNVRPERNAASLAEKEQVELRLHTVIYELADELKLAMAGLLDPTLKEVQKGTADVREIFTVPKVGVVAGCHVVDGVIPRSASVRLLRDNIVIYEGKISSLRRFKEDASEVRNGFDCGIGLDRFQDIKPGDMIEAFVREEVAAVL